MVSPSSASQNLEVLGSAGFQMQKPATHLNYRPDIDGLRAIAVLTVVIFHAFPNLLPSGFIGVDIFFIISGYLISSIIFKGLDAGSFGFADFFSRRIRRIFPALFVVLVATLTFGWLVLAPDELNQLGKHAAAGAAFVANLALMGEAGYFDNSAGTKPLLHLWSLGIEEQFYIVFPALMWAAWKMRLRGIYILVPMVLLSFWLNIHLISRTPVEAFYSPLSRFWELLIGSLLAWLMLYHRPALTKATANLCSALGGALLVAGLIFIREDATFPGYWALMPTLGAALLIGAGPGAWFNQKVLASSVAVWFGLISYSLYLWHWPLLSFARIIYNEPPPTGVRMLLVLVAIGLAWLSLRFVETPFRRNRPRNARAVALLCAATAGVGLSGLAMSKADFSATHGYDQLAIPRRGFEHAIGHSLRWYRGKDDWLFLGDAYDQTVSKLKLATRPKPESIEATRNLFGKITTTAAGFGAETILFIGPSKSTIYPEYLPDSLTPSPTRYVSAYLDALRTVPHLKVYDPTDRLRAAKTRDGLLYWMTDTHWNYRGAYQAFAGFTKLAGVPAPEVTFTQGHPHRGDLIGISNQPHFPLHAEDSWKVTWPNTPAWTETVVDGLKNDTFGQPSVVNNSKALSDKYVWVVGDSFTTALRPYFNATFREVRYMGHWGDQLSKLPEELDKAERKPDLVVIVRVERSL